MIDLDPEEFRRLGHAFIDWVAGYRAGLPDRPVRPDVAPGAVRDQLGPLVRERPLPLETLLDEVDRPVVPATLRWQHAAFFGYFPALASLLGDLLSGGLRAQGMLWSSARAGTEVDQGLAYLTHTVVDGRYTIRVAIGGVSTDGATVDALWRQLRDIADTLRPRSLAIGAPGGRARHESATDGTITSPC